MDIERICSRVVYENRWMRVREDAVRRRDGSDGIYGVVEKPDFVVIVPMEEDGRLHLVQQFRYPVGGRYWEFPQGSWEGVYPRRIRWRSLLASFGRRPASTQRRCLVPGICSKVTATPTRATTSSWPAACTTLRRTRNRRSRTS